MAAWVPWRADGRCLYACFDGGEDERIGEMTNELLAQESALAHNASLRHVDAPISATPPTREEMFADG